MPSIFSSSSNVVAMNPSKSEEKSYSKIFRTSEIMCGFLLTYGCDQSYHEHHLKSISRRGQDSTKTFLLNED